MDTSSDQPTSKQDTLVDTEEDPELPLAAFIEKQMHDLDPISSTPCIYRVPPTLRQVSEKSYTPQIVSIGPFHHGKMELGQWEEHKLRYLQAFLYRTQKSLKDCIKLVKDWEERARKCYRERINLSSNEFFIMMLVDSCFIIEVMRRFQECAWEDPTDCLSNPDLIYSVRRDMILLENQIPFFVLQGLFRSGFNQGEDKFIEDKFIELSINYFSGLLVTVTEAVDVERTITNVVTSNVVRSEIKHLTDLLRICHLQPILLKPIKNDSIVQIPTATRLHEAGMKFKIGTSKCLIDMQYNKTGLLEMTKFKVEDTTECLLRNLIALEMCHYPLDSCIIEYAYFMDMFIDTARDVDLLRKKGIIVNFLSDSAAVASVFNNLGKEAATVTSYNYLASISGKIKAYSNDPWHKWKATFKRDYCSTPWMIAATATAILVAVLTLTSTICTIISIF